MSDIPTPELVLLVGLQGAGKSTFFARRFAASHLHVSKDLWPNGRHREERQRRVVDQALAEGRSVVVDNTNPTAADRAGVIALARQHGARVVGYYFPPSLAESLQRNAWREGKKRVPDKAILITRARLEPPRWEEGFDALFLVHNRLELGFDVTELPPGQAVPPP